MRFGYYPILTMTRTQDEGMPRTHSPMRPVDEISRLGRLWVAGDDCYSAAVVVGSV
jgi:hypothetical protein